MRILITGGAGYVGIPLTRRLADDGHDVRVFDRFFFGDDLFGALADAPNVELIRGDIRSIDLEAMEGVDVVVDLAGLSNDPSADLDPALTRQINLDGAVRTATIAKQAGAARYVYSSSCSVYGAAEGTCSEESALSPVSLYAEMKVAAEEQIFAMADDDFTVTALRNATIYGLAPRMRFDLVVNAMTLNAYNDGTVTVTGGGDQWRPLVHVDDVARAFVIAVGAPAEAIQGEAFNIGSDAQNYQVSEIAEVVGKMVPETTIHYAADDADQRSYRVDFTKASQQLGFAPDMDVPAAVEEIYTALIRGEVITDDRTRTVKRYQDLLAAEETFNTFSLDGRML